MMRDGYMLLICLIFLVSPVYGQNWWDNTAPQVQPATMQYTYSGADQGGTQYNAMVDYQNHIMEFTADGTVNLRKVDNPIQAEIMAKSAAETRAYAQVAKFITGVFIKGVYITEMGAAEEEQIAAKLEGTTVKYAQVLKSEVTWIQGVPKGTVTLGVSFRNYNGLPQLVLPELGSMAKENGWQLYQLPEQVVTPNDTDYTGLIVDTHGLNIRPAAFPVISVGDEKKEVYGPLKFMETGVEEHDNSIGVVGYYKTVESAQADQRVGDNPLLVKANGEWNGNRNVTVSTDDAAKIYAADLKKNFLKERRVVFLID